MLNLREELAKLELTRGKYEKIFPGYITHIRFPRYKNIVDDTRLDFTFPITALVGVNGSGKTSVLNALYGAPARKSTGQYWFSTKVDPIEEGEGSPSRFIYGHQNPTLKAVVETRKARVRKFRDGRLDPNYWEPTKESPGDDMVEPALKQGKKYIGRSKDRWNPVMRKVLYINFRKEISAFDKYFYFGKNPALQTSAKPMPVEPMKDASAKVADASPKKPNPRRIINKKDQVRHDAELLSRVIAAGDTSYLYRNRKVATENRLLNQEELKTVSFVLGRDYEEARWIRHRLFKGDGGLSIVFKTKHGRYSEAFAGSGEVAVTSCVVQVLGTTKGTLILLDEPEVSLHPGAQERLLAFLACRARSWQLQIVFSTHSPHLVAALPDDAIKTFHQLDDGRFSVIPSTHPYAAFRRLGAEDGGRVRVIVEDRLAKEVVQQALLTLSDDAERRVFNVEYPSGGADTILMYQIPVLIDTPMHTLVLLDGDKRRVNEFIDPSAIPESQNSTLTQIIKDSVGLEPRLIVDGGAGGGNTLQLFNAQRKYLAWIRKNVEFIPTQSPEELVLRAAGKADPKALTSLEHKDTLRHLVEELFGKDVTNERTDEFGVTLLATNRSTSKEIHELAQILKSYLASAQKIT
ncbi:AAA family ATPase [Pseudomonas agarici]|uniref:AAA family ATPase n=1 Tax=Pseudomonas agarici TaxID=46677 RepID=UPI0008B567DC|nr:AAA family ATPase [Pseudomonas agarici]NWB92568.1 AAA family ATPase [Pseudomonas agarici]NWC07605.1 AAA family ATPase [Pseudomonas agarici]SEL06199.1 AAA ATPase domain-containing protein [Pseudomonas agarici]